jgi:molybdopterin-containing oxidoreductase family iron-sulfur binding subunit
LKKAAFRVVLADFMDQTAEAADLILPLSHSLESWGDARPRRNVTTIIRPAVKPLHDTRTQGDILLGFMQWKNQPEAKNTYQEYLFSEWGRRWDRNTLKKFAEEGFLVEDGPKPEITLDPVRTAAAFRNMTIADPFPEMALVVTPSIRKFDGRSDSLPLLSELPDPLTTVTYGNWVSVSPAAAKELGIRDRDRIRLVGDNWKAEFAAKIQPGLADKVVMLQKDMLDSIPWEVDDVSGEALTCLKLKKIEKAKGKVGIPIMAGSVSQAGRGIIPTPISKEEHEKHKRLNLYPDPDYPRYRWAMGIDLNLCIGCGACTAACYVENNIPLVGPEEHLKGREMSWLRVEPFYSPEGELDFLPMLCQQCDYAPCEPVCPVYASLHNPEGLNLQVYNRCVGTRYCANNCPYKVRRFNWFTHRREGLEKRMLNPDLTTRTKGMMEKCTFCIQRIRIARDRAKDEKRLIRDGEVIPACAQSCPTGAIVFGNLLDKNSKISGLTGSDRAYRVFEELGTDPAVYYLHDKNRKHGGQDTES